MAEASEPIVRPVTRADAATVEALLTNVWVGEGFTPVELGNAFGDVMHRALSAHVLVAVDPATETIVGTIMLARPGTPYAQIATDGEMEARHLAVDTGARGRGIAERLMEACMRYAAAEGVAGLVLSTQERQSAAQRLYERMGFERQPARDWFRPSSGRRMLVYVKATATEAG